MAIGQPELVKGDWVKPGAVVIDCGINAVLGKLHYNFKILLKILCDTDSIIKTSGGQVRKSLKTDCCPNK